MRVFVFDLLAYDEKLDHLKLDNELPYPLPKRFFKPDVAVRTYEEHLAAWEEMDRLSYDGVSFNEHHCSPYGLMNSPNLMAAAAAQRTKKLKLMIYGNLLPLHEPLRLAEELAMVDCLSNGRLICGFARGIPREYQVHQVPMAESRGRFEEAFDIVTKVWQEEIFSYDGKYWKYNDVAIWPRPVQTPRPEIWIPIVSSKESIEFAAKHNVSITPGLDGGGLQQDIIRYYSQCLSQNGFRITPNHLSIGVGAYVADSKAEGVREYAPYHLYFHRTLFNHGSFTETAKQRVQGFVSQSSTDYVRPDNVKSSAGFMDNFRNMTIADFERKAETMPIGTADEVVERIIQAAEAAGANNVLIHMNRGALPQEMFLEQIRRFGKDVLPRLQAHQVRAVPLENAA